jgi:hypothetical protein
MDSYPGRKGGTAVAIRKSIPHNHADQPPPLVSVEGTGVCIPFVNYVVILAAVYKSPMLALEYYGHRLKRKRILAGDVNDKHSFWNSLVSNPLGEEFLELLHKNEFEISGHRAPPITAERNGDILDIVVHKNIALQGSTVLPFILVISWTQITYQ